MIELLNRMFKLSTPNEKEKSNTPNKSPQPSAIFITTINPDSSITEETKPYTPSTPVINEEKVEPEKSTTDDDKLKFVPLERKPEYGLTILITSQGQEVLKSSSVEREKRLGFSTFCFLAENWSFFVGPLQQRLNVIVNNVIRSNRKFAFLFPFCSHIFQPFKLNKFGDNQWQNELTITGEQIESLVDAVIQLTAFINDVLGIAAQPFNSNASRSTFGKIDVFFVSRRSIENSSQRTRVEQQLSTDAVAAPKSIVAVRKLSRSNVFQSGSTRSLRTSDSHSKQLRRAHRR